METIRRITYLVVGAVLVCVFTYSAAGLILSQIAFNSPLEQQFLSGKLPVMIPDGGYRGKSDNQGNWTGITFNAAAATGINSFLEAGTQIEKYPFTVYAAPGIQDAEKEVLKLDYNTPENDIYMRFFQQEIVETSPGHYLGKLQVRLIPFIPFVVGFFELQK